MKNGQDHFGVPAENIAAAQKWAQMMSKHPVHTNVPTRNEVATLGHDELHAILIGWMLHSPLEIIPSRTQIDDVRTILLNRSDANNFANLIRMCDNYINNSH